MTTDPVQLDTLETSNIARPPDSYRSFCESHCKAELDATRNLYEKFFTRNAIKRLDSFDSCRTGAYFVRNQVTGKVRVLSQSCKLRWCPMCSATRRWFLTQQVSEWLIGARKPKFLTLTLAHSTAPLDTQLIRLYDSFRKYRKLNLLRKSVSGGVWFFQIKKSKSDGLWHPHLHCVIDSEWIDKYDLSEAWEKVTTDSKIIDIKTVSDVDSMSDYVARYAARPSLLSSVDEPDRLELAESLHGRRLVGTWGNARSISLRPSKPPDADDWVEVGSWSIVTMLLGDDDRADSIWKAYKTDSECPADCSLLDLQDEINRLEPFGAWSPPERHQIWLDFW